DELLSLDGRCPGLPADTRRAEEVHQRVVHALAQLAPDELDEARLGPERLAAGETRERPPVVEARDLDLDPVLGETLAEDGIPGPGWTAVHALAREAEEVLEEHAVDDELPRRSAALVREGRVGDRPARMLRADELRTWNEDLVEEDLVELLAPRHLAEGANGHARSVHVADEVADALRFGSVGVGPGEEDPPARELRVARPHLLAGDDPAVAASLGAGAERRQVRAGARLGEELTPELLGRQDRRQEAAPLFLGAVRDERRADEIHADPVDDLGGARGGDPLLEDVV